MSVTPDDTCLSAWTGPGSPAGQPVFAKYLSIRT